MHTTCVCRSSDPTSTSTFNSSSIYAPEFRPLFLVHKFLRFTLQKMFKFRLIVAAILTLGSAAFSPALNYQPSKTLLSAAATREVDDNGNNIAVKNLLFQVESSRLLSQVAKAGLLTKAQKSGVSLAKLEPLIKLAASNKDVMILVEAAAPEALPILPKIIELAPAALPLLASAIEIPPAALQAAALASVVAAGAGVYFIPDDTVVEVASQTLLVGLLGIAAPVASIIGATVLSKVKGL